MPALPTTAAAAVPVPAQPATVEVRYRVELRTPDTSVADFADWLRAILTDPRGWVRAGFLLVEDPAAPYAVVLAEGPEVDALCEPYDVGGRFSCQNGPVVALNADRWRTATPTWTLDLTAYRTMLVNHEVGHLLGMHHLRCKAAGAVSPVMAQQSGGLDGCLANPWPTEVEVMLAATHQFLLAPPYAEVAYPP